jgi:protease-4
VEGSILKREMRPGATPNGALAEFWWLKAASWVLFQDMKNFFTSMLGALAALVVFSVAGFILFLGILGALVALGHQKNASAGAVETGSYLVFDLAAPITDAPPAFDLGALGSDRKQALQLRSVTRAFRAAARDSRIAGVLLIGSADTGAGYGALREVRNALGDFRRAGKPVKAYLDFATTRDYYVASAANEITLDPYGMIYLPGLAVEPMFFAGAAEKYGVNFQVTRVGKYKSFVEPFTRRDMSPENREETQRLLDDVWGSLLADIGRARRLAPDKIQATVDAEGLIQPDAAKAARLVDRVAYRDQVVDALKAETGRAGSKESFKQVSLENYIRLLRDPGERTSAGTVAIVYAEGDIVDGDGEPGEIGGDAFAREFRKLREDDAVKAVVLRVDSPGGSATAAEAMEREIRLTHQVKPVIVSMGSYAASGGYWISAGADRIFAEPTTITGSIGVFGIQFDVQRLLNNLGITFDGVKTGKFADSLTITRPKTAEELAIFQHMVDWIYGQFIGKVADGRKMTREQVEAIAQGRVWSGAEARRIGLVDAMGGLDTAVGYAAEKAGLSAGFRVVEYPEKKTLADELTEFFGKFAGDSTRVPAHGIVGQIEARLGAEWANLRAFNDPQSLYARLPLELTVR